MTQRNVAAEAQTIPAYTEETHAYYERIRERPLDCLAGAGQRLVDALWPP